MDVLSAFDAAVTAHHQLRNALYRARAVAAGSDADAARAAAAELHNAAHGLQLALDELQHASAIVVPADEPDTDAPA